MRCKPSKEMIRRLPEVGAGMIDGFFRSKRKLIALLGEQKQAIIHRAVTRGLDNPRISADHNPNQLRPSAKSEDKNVQSSTP